MMEQTSMLSSSLENSGLGVLHLKRYWEKMIRNKTNCFTVSDAENEWNIDTTLLAVLGLGLEQTIQYIYQYSKSFADFEDWIRERSGSALDQEKIREFNNYILNRSVNSSNATADIAVLSAADLAHFDKEGYVILREAVPQEDCENAIRAICEFIDVDRSDPDTWYRIHPERKGIMVQLFQHAALEKNRRSSRIRMAYEQLWQRKDLWVNTDRAGFNPPETKQWRFPGPRLHWDVSLALPIPFGLQGILYLSDTMANQGAFTLVPGFQHKVEDWLAGLPADAKPRDQDLYALGPIPIVANAGDFIIWHQALPHGSSPNSSSQPRIVQYINYAPLDAEIRQEWI